MPPALSFGSTLQSATFSRWIWSLLGLMGLVLGIPVVLVAFHLTPPITQLGYLIGHPRTAVHYLNHSLTDAAVARSLTCVTWIAWIWLVVCVALETSAVVRGRPSLHLPGSRHVQSLITTLVGASLAVFPIGRDGLPMRFVAAPTAIQTTAGHGGEVTFPYQSVVPWVSPARDPTGTANDAALEVTGDQTPLPTPGATYIVKPGDTLWSIAERELGSPLRWPRNCRPELRPDPT